MVSLEGIQFLVRPIFSCYTYLQIQKSHFFLKKVYTLAHELYPGKFRPTITHSFVRLLAEQSLLHTCFTQNIDTLERRAGVPNDKVIEAHGSFATQRCIDCKRSFDDKKMKEHIEAKKIAKCEVCGGYVKPDIVFFGEGVSVS